MELLSYPGLTARGKNQIRNFLTDLEIVGIDESVRDQTIEVKKKSHLICQTALLRLQQ